MGNFGHSIFLGCYLDFDSNTKKRVFESKLYELIITSAKSNSFCDAVLELHLTSVNDSILSSFYEYIADYLIEIGEEEDNQYYLLRQTNMAKDINYTEAIQEFPIKTSAASEIENCKQSEVYKDFIRFITSNSSAKLKYGLVMVYKEIL